MTLQRLVGALCAGLIAVSTPVMATEQASFVMPVTGPMSMATFAGTYLTPALRAIASCHWGPSAPLNGPGSVAIVYQCWADTTANPVLVKRWDGTSWVIEGALDTSAHTWTPYRNGAAIVAVATSGSAADLTTGTLPAARLPNPSGSTLGGTQSKSCSASNWLNTISTSGVPGCAQPNFSDLVGSIACSQLPALTGDVTRPSGSCVTTLANIPTGTPAAGSILATNIAAPSTPAAGKISVFTDSTDKRLHDKNDAGVIGTTAVGYSSVSHQFLTGMNTNGVFAGAQPSCADISGASVFCSGTSAANLTGTQATATIPAFTGGDVSSAGGSVVLTINSAAVTYAKIQNVAASRLLGNPTGSPAAPSEISLDTTLGFSGTSLKCTTGTTLQLGCLKPDGTTITVAAGVITASGASATSITPGTTTVSGGSANAGYALTNNGGALSNSSLFSSAGGSINALRNATLVSWYHGCFASSCTITTAGTWCAEGIWVVPSGASVTCQQAAQTTGASLNGMKVTGAASVTGVKIRFVIESNTAIANVTNKTVTFQFQWINNSGSTITPTVATKYAASGFDNWTTSTADLAATNLQACTNGSTCTEAYTFAASVNGYLGYEVIVDFGNNFGNGANTLTLLGGFDLRSTPGVATGLNANPPVPELRTPADEEAWNRRFFETTYNNGVATGNATAAGEMDLIAGGTNAMILPVHLSVPKRANPTVTIFSPSSGASGNCFNNSSAADVAASVFSSSQGFGGFSLLSNGTMSAGQGIRCHWSADALGTAGGVGVSGAN